MNCDVTLQADEFKKLHNGLWELDCMVEKLVNGNVYEGQKLAAIAQEEKVDYLDLYPHFADARGELRPELTTDGLHLSAVGYGVWQSVLREVDYLFAAASRSLLAS